VRFSIIMPSYIANYRGSASNKEGKIVRAIDSVLCQTFKDFELIVIADGCQKTVEIVKNITDKRIRLFLIEKQPMWSGLVRNTGLEMSKGAWMVYLDIDDMWGEDHLKIINDQIQDEDWVWFNDRSWDGGQQQFNEHHCGLKKGHCGTSNIAHKQGLTGWGMKGNYLHDWVFILRLMQVSQNYKRIETPQYLVCHCPHIMDYDGESKKMS